MAKVITTINIEEEIRNAVKKAVKLERPKSSLSRKAEELFIQYLKEQTKEKKDG